MHVTTRAAALAVAALLALGLAACGGGGPEGNDTNASLAAGQGQINEQPYDNVRDGGTLTTATPEINPQFNTAHADGTADTLLLWKWYNPILFLFSPRGDPKPNPDYLTDVRQETVGGNTKITYSIEPRAVFNDGTPIDWRAFESTWRVSNGTNPAYLVDSTDGYDRIASVTPGASAKQAVVTYRGTDVWWQGLFNFLVHPAASAPEVFNNAYVENPHPEWGAGPYTVEQYDKQNGTITFVRNPRWWRPRGKLDRRVIVTMESSTSINAFKNGQLDATSVATQDRLAQVQGLPGIEIRKSSTPKSALFTLNSRSPVLADPRVRRSIFAGVDRTQLQKILFQGLGYTEPLPGSLNLLPFQDGYRDNFPQVVTFDPARADADLDGAGWTRGPDGIRQRGGQRLTISYVNYGDDPTSKAVAGATTAMLKQIGVDVAVRQVPANEFSKILNARQFDLFFSAYQQTDPFGLAYICQTWCSTSTLNRSGTGDAAFDREVQSVNQLPSAQAQYDKASDVEKKAFGFYGVMPIYNGPTIVAVKQGLANYGAGGFFVPRPEDIGFQK